MWCAFIVADAYLVQEHARETLASIARGGPSSSSTATVSPSDSSSSTTHPPRTVARGTPLAELLIPRLGLSEIVFHGSDAHTLSLGLGHIENTPLPGESGNVAIAGHRDSFFRPLRKVKVGDDILLDTPDERVHYRVSSLRVVNSYEVSVIGATRDATLTLVTCYPFWFIGQAPDRFVVRATRVEDSADAASTSAAYQASEPDHASYIDVPPTGANGVVAARTGGTAPRREDAATPSHDGHAADPAVSGHGKRAIHAEYRALADQGSSDDDALVRQVVEHFRLTYNARMARHAGANPGEVVTFPFCEVAIADTTAKAMCRATSQSAERVSSQVWTFSLGSNGGEWTITSVEMR